MGSATWLSGGESAAILNLDIERWFYMIESSCCIEVRFLFTFGRLVQPHCRLTGFGICLIETYWSPCRQEQQTTTIMFSSRDIWSRVGAKHIRQVV